MRKSPHVWRSKNALCFSLFSRCQLNQGQTALTEIWICQQLCFPQAASIPASACLQGCNTSEPGWNGAAMITVCSVPMYSAATQKDQNRRLVFCTTMPSWTHPFQAQRLHQRLKQKPAPKHLAADLVKFIGKKIREILQKQSSLMGP